MSASWKDYIAPGEELAGKSAPLETCSFGDAWPITRGLRFGEPVFAKGQDEGGEWVEIESPVTVKVLAFWTDYVNLLGFAPKWREHISPEFVQIDDRAWSLQFSVDNSVDEATLDDFGDYLVQWAFPKNGLLFDTWSTSYTNLDDARVKEFGLCEVKNFARAEHSRIEDARIPVRETPLKHSANGSIEFLRERAFAQCIFCSYTGTVWCTESQIDVLERFQNGASVEITNAFSPWQIATFATGMHEWCMQANSKDQNVRGIVQKARGID
jgi:hypothetical protein